MKANAVPFRFLFSESKVTIPFFQREYVWDSDNWEDILNDLCNNQESHFFGSIILRPISESGKTKEVLVIDGQQRLTTLSVLIRALYDNFPDVVKKNVDSEFKNCLFYKKEASSPDYFIKIQHSHIDAEAYEKVINGNVQIEDIKEGSNRILQCYKYFAIKLKERNEENNKALFNMLLPPDNEKNKILVIIDLGENDDEQEIFDTINSTGVRLNCADTIKNTLFQTVVKLSDEKQAIDLYNKTWWQTFLVDEDAKNYWETERLTGRLKRDNVEILLHCIAVIKGFYNPEKDALADLPKRYKEQTTKKTKKEIELFINEIKRYADIYREKIPYFGKNTSLSFSEGVNRILHILEVLEISTFYPFILFVLETFKDKQNDIQCFFYNLEKLVVRRAISHQETRSYNKFCKEFIENPEKIADKLKETTNEQVSNGLKNISNNNAALLLFWIELNRRSKDKKYDQELKYNYSLEHIMPQKWKEHWKYIPDKFNADNGKMTEEESVADRDNKVYWIGNMTLLKSSLNTSLRNYDFKAKIEGEGSKKGIRHFAELLVAKDDIVAKFDNGKTSWDESRIIERTTNLEKEIINIWG